MKKMLMLFSLILIIFLFTGCITETQPTLTLEETYLVIGLGEEYELQPITTHYEGGFNLTLTDEEIVSKQGLTITGLKEGTTMVILSLSSAPDLKVYCFIDVVNEDLPYPISYCLNGGSISISSPIQYKVSELPFTLPIPKRTDYTFGGWYTSKTFEGSSISAIPDNTTGPITLYAKWNA